MKTVEYTVLAVLAFVCIFLGVRLVAGPQARSATTGGASSSQPPTHSTPAGDSQEADLVNPPAADPDETVLPTADDRRLKNAKDAWGAFVSAVKRNASDAEQRAIRAGTANHPALIEDYKKGLLDENPLVRKTAITALMLLHTTEAGEALVSGYSKETNTEVQVAILGALGHYCGDERAVDILRTAVASQERNISFTAITTLARKGNLETATEFMKKRLAAVSTREERSPIIVSLGILAERGSLSAAQELVSAFRATTDSDERKGIHGRLVKAGHLSLLSDSDLKLLEENK